MAKNQDIEVAVSETSSLRELKPRVAVVGLGRYFRKLRKGLSEQFELTSLIDVSSMPAHRGWLYKKLQVTPLDAVMILTPNQFHGPQVEEIAPLRFPVFVEKPLATTEESLNLVLNSLTINPRLFCSDFYPDVRALPLKYWLGQKIEWAQNYMQIHGDVGLWNQGLNSLGRIHRVEGVLLEGEGEAASFEGRDWLWDPVHGGVLWDLAYHYLTLWHELFGEPLILLSARLGVVNLAPPDLVAETSARLDLKSASGIDMSMHVKKYHTGENERWFRLEADNGVAVMTFAKVNSLTVESKGRRCIAELKGDYYAMVAEAFRWFLQFPHNTTHGLEASCNAVRIILQAKKELPARRIEA